MKLKLFIRFNIFILIFFILSCDLVMENDWDRGDFDLIVPPIDNKDLDNKDLDNKDLDNKDKDNFKRPLKKVTLYKKKTYCYTTAIIDNSDYELLSFFHDYFGTFKRIVFYFLLEKITIVDNVFRKLELSHLEGLEDLLKREGFDNESLISYFIKLAREALEERGEINTDVKLCEYFHINFIKTIYDILSIKFEKIYYYIEYFFKKALL